MKAGKWKSGVVLFLLGMVSVHSVVLWQTHDLILQGYGDFAALYTAGTLVQRGQASAMYDRRVQWAVQQEFSSTVTIRNGPLPYIRPPFEALLFVLLAYLSYPVASMVWMAVKVLILLGIPFLLQPHLLRDRLLPASIEGLLCLSFFPVVFDLLQGQDAILLLLVFVLAFTALQRGADFRSGLFLALGLFKFHLVIPIVLVLLLRRKTRVLIGFLLTAFALVLISVALVGWAGLLGYPKYLWDLNQASGVGVIKSQSMPNFRGLITVYVGRAPLPGHAHWFLVPIAIAGIVFTAWVWRGTDNHDPRLSSAGFSLAIVMTILTSYYAYSYDMTLLILPILVLGGSFLRSVELQGWPQGIFLSSAALLLFSPLYWFLILRLDQFYWIVLVELLLVVSMAWAMKIWRRGLTMD
jgi:hypothetical protein